jgi:hypothetical protein
MCKGFEETHGTCASSSPRRLRGDIRVQSISVRAGSMRKIGWGNVGLPSVLGNCSSLCIARMHELSPDLTASHNKVRQHIRHEVGDRSACSDHYLS